MITLSPQPDDTGNCNASHCRKRSTVVLGYQVVRCKFGKVREVGLCEQHWKEFCDG